MALSHSPRIVTNGLVLALDAANQKSYNTVTSTSTWYDLSGNNKSGTLNGNITYYSTNSGFLSFGLVSTTTDYISFSSTPTISSAAGLTVEVWGKFNTYAGGSNTYYIVGAKNSIFRMMYTGSSFQWAMATSNNGWYSTGTTLVIPNVTIGNWNHGVFVYNGANILGYLNGQLNSITTNAISGTIPTVTSFIISNSDASNVSYAVGSVGAVKIYNRALSADEISQNFNAYRGRYGL